MPTRVVVCTAAVGHGHTKAAHALQEGLLACDPTLQIDFVETLEHASPWFVRPYRDGYLAAIARVPALAGWMYKTMDKPSRADGKLGRMIERRGLRRFCDLPSLASADLVVTSHFLCARVLADLRTAGVLRAPVAVCVTDLHPHAVWLARGNDAILVASDQSREAAIRAGIDPDRVIVTGIPIDRRFERREDKASARATLNLPPPDQRPVVLVAGGGLGLGGIDGVVRRLLAREGGKPIHVAVICGRNDALKAALTPLARDWRTAAPNEPSATIEGFTSDMPRWMAAADVLVGKPGGLSTAEGCASGLPLVLLKPIPGQEERNAQHLCDRGAAVLRIGDEAAADEAAALALDKARLAEMSAASARLGRPEAALTAARAALALIKRHGRSSGEAEARAAG